MQGNTGEHTPGERSADDWRALMHAAISNVLNELSSLSEEDQIVHSASVNTALLDAQAEVAMARRAAVRALRLQGMTLRDIATATGLTPQRVGQIEGGLGRKEKAAGGRVGV
jgi:DNA-directed RNA polymerase specialized sigma24 family protein